MEITTVSDSSPRRTMMSPSRTKSIMITAILLLLLVVVKAQGENVQAPPERPRLSPNRDDKVYVSDERIIFTCTPPNGLDPISDSLFYELKQQTPVKSQSYSWQSSEAFNVKDTSTGINDFYCVYSRLMHGRNVTSERSETVRITVVAPPEKPRLSPNRDDKIYVSDERIIFTCTPPNGLDPISDSLFYELKQQTPVKSQSYSWQSSEAFNVKDTSTGINDFYCVYSRLMHGRNVMSERSETVRITVVAPPEKPRLSPNRDDKIYVSDERIIFTCTPPNGLDPISDSLFYELKQQTPVKSQSYSWQSSEAFNVKDTITGINDFYCVYSRLMHGRNVMSERSETVRITVVAPPEKPRLSPNRDDKIYVSDERIIFTCTPPNGLDPISDSQFYKLEQQAPVKSLYNRWQRSKAFNVKDTSTGINDFYCVYSRLMHGRNVMSERSETVRITVVAPPEKPRLSPNRDDKIYVSDERIIFTCTPPNGLVPISDSQFYKLEQQAPVKSLYNRWQRSKAFNVKDTSTGINDFYCVYSRLMHGRNVMSERSETVRITVVDLPRPSISLDPSYVSPGDDVTFNCTSTKSISVETFYLYKNGVRLNDSVPQSVDAQDKSTTFTIQNVDPGNSGNYTCAYKLLKADRHLISAPSASVLLAVRVKSIQTWIPALPVVALVLMFGVLGVYCWKKGKSRGRGEFRADPVPKDGPNNNENIVYADLKVIPRTKKKGKKECTETHADDSAVYADVKL
ncbi:uncharacterized protein LOC134339077 isoform X2 [Mobula hypostoma]|uniref:uncharacterized protein LOC134339077 isoform X2 n=1 Tax=Mobula hypostoma TaxID=723540 RepID=UPI002FC35B78